MTRKEGKAKRQSTFISFATLAQEQFRSRTQVEQLSLAVCEVCVFFFRLSPPHSQWSLCFPVVKCCFANISFVMVCALEFEKLFSRVLRFKCRVPKHSVHRDLLDVVVSDGLLKMEVLVDSERSPQCETKLTRLSGRSRCRSTNQCRNTSSKCLCRTS